MKSFATSAIDGLIAGLVAVGLGVIIIWLVGRLEAAGCETFYAKPVVAATIVPVTIGEEGVNGWLKPAAIEQNLPPLMILKGCREGDRIRRNGDDMVELERNGRLMGNFSLIDKDLPIAHLVLLQDDAGRVLAVYDLAETRVAMSTLLERKAMQEYQRDHPNK